MRARPALVHKLASAAAGVALAIAVALALGACGRSAPRPVAPVKLSHLAPSGGARVDASRITVSGVVKPRHARVMVLGRRVQPAAGGHFAATVKLQVGTNLIDVIAAAPHARPAMTALRVVRYVLVSVPSVTGRSPRAAAAIIRSAGLRVKLDSDGNPFSFLVPFSQRVCSQSPAAQARVAPDTTITLDVGKVCL